MRRPLALLAVIASLALSLLLTACGGEGTLVDDSRLAGDGELAERTITVLAASSLTEVFTALGEEFEAENPGVRVRFAFDSSATLAQQAAQGAPADVLATADAATMQQAVAADATIGEVTTFARNHLVLAVPADNPAGVMSLGDLDADPSPTYVICVPTAPCGDLAARALEADGVTAAPASLEVDVKAVLAKVVDDEADAGLVYATDAVAAGDDVTSFEIDGAARQETVYPAAVLVEAVQPDLARRWIAFLTARPGRTALTAAGFDQP